MKKSLKENSSDLDKIYVEINCGPVFAAHPEYDPVYDMSNPAVEEEANIYYRAQEKALKEAGLEVGWTNVYSSPEDGPSEHDFDEATQYWTGTVAQLRAAVEAGLDTMGIAVFQTLLDEPVEVADEDGYPIPTVFSDEITDIESLIWESDEYMPGMEDDEMMAENKNRKPSKKPMKEEHEGGRSGFIVYQNYNGENDGYVTEYGELGPQDEAEIYDTFTDAYNIVGELMDHAEPDLANQAIDSMEILITKVYTREEDGGIEEIEDVYTQKIEISGND